MATKQQLFSYDDVEHKEIDIFFNSLKKREKSKYIRLALREYIIKHTNLIEQSSTVSATNNYTEKQAIPAYDNQPEKEDNYKEVDDSMLDLGR